MTNQLMKGNEAIIRGALLGGATHFFGYPITPASEITHAAAQYFSKAGRVFLQAECEVNAINMVYGAAAAGARVMTATSGPGLSLMAEGLSYLAGAELPSVIVNVQRAGPGLGNIWPEQSDYNMVVKGGGHGDYRNIVLAPSSVQEMCDMTHTAFDLADKYRMTVMILADAYVGQIMEPVAIPEKVIRGNRKDWAVYADKESRENLVSSIYLNAQNLSDFNQKLQDKYKLIEEECVLFEENFTDDAEYIFVAFGISARVCLTVTQRLRKQGIKIGLFRPKTLFPFPKKRIFELANQVKKFMVVELNGGQMCDDVELACRCKVPVEKINWMGGKVPSAEELMERVKEGLQA